MVRHALRPISVDDNAPVTGGGKLENERLPAPVSDDVVAGNERIVVF